MKVESSCPAVRKLIGYLLIASSSWLAISLCHVMPRLAIFSFVVCDNMTMKQTTPAVFATRKCFYLSVVYFNLEAHLC